MDQIICNDWQLEEQRRPQKITDSNAPKCKKNSKSYTTRHRRRLLLSLRPRANEFKVARIDDTRNACNTNSYY